MAGDGDRNWADLPCDLLGSIGEQLPVKDFFKFGSVCTSWAASVASVVPRPPEMPYLLHLTEGGDAVLVSFPDCSQHRVTGVAEFQDKWLVGSQFGWVALLDERSEVTLLNPLTREQIRLPSVTTISQLTPIYDPAGSDRMSGYRFSQTGRDQDLRSYTFDEFSFTSFQKIVVSSRPRGGGGGGRGFTAMVIFTEFSMPAFARAGEDEWILMQNLPFISDIIYRQGKFLGVSYDGILLAIDVTLPSPELTMLARGWDVPAAVWDIDKYLVESAGDLLMVGRKIDDEFKTSAIIVLKFSEEKSTWLPCKSLGDNSLFLGLCSSFSLSVREIPELKPNSIYYTEILRDWLTAEILRYLTADEEEIQMPRQVWVFNMEDQTFDHYTPVDDRLNWHPPVWIIPSLL